MSKMQSTISYTGSGYSSATTTIVLSFGKTIALASSILILVALARLLTVDAYGAFAQVMTIYAILSLVMQVGTPQAVYYFLPRLSSRLQYGLAVQSTAFLAALGAVGAFFLYFGADYVGQFWNSPELPSLLRAFSPYPMFALPLVALEAVLVALGRPLTVAIFSPAAKLSGLLAVVLPVYVGTSLVTGIRIWVLVASLHTLIGMYLLRRAFRGIKLSLSLHSFREQVSYSSAFAVASILGTLAYYADKLLVGASVEPGSYAYYVNGAMELPVVAVVGAAVTMAITPEMVRLARDALGVEALALWHRTQAKVGLVLLPLCIFFFFFAEETVSVLFGPRYAASAVFFRIFLLLVPTRLASFQAIMGPLGLNRAYAVGHFIQFVFSFALVALFLRIFGMPGAAAGAVGAAYINGLFLAHVTSRALGARIIEMWPLRRLAHIVAVATLASLLGWLAAGLLPNGEQAAILTRLASGFCVSLAVYIAAGVALGLFSLHLVSSPFWRR